MNLTRLSLLCVISTALLLAGCSKSPTPDKIKADLIGREFTSAPYSWKFESPSEFRDLQITNTTQTDNLIEYSVVTHLIGSKHSEVEANLLLSYRKENGEWKLINLRETGKFSESTRGDPPPVEAMGKMFAEGIGKHSNGIIKVVQFDKTTGQFDQQKNKYISYRMEVSMIVEFQGDCTYFGSKLEVTPGLPSNGGWDEFQGRRPGHKGERKIFGAILTFSKSDKKEKWDWDWELR